MTNRRLSHSPFLIAFTILLVSVPIAAQSVTTTISPVTFQRDNHRADSLSTKTVAASVGAESDTNFGSVNGRVVLDVLASPESKTSVTKGVAGTKVLLRRLDGGMAGFFFERLSDADGKYEFQSIRPGRYTIEIDRASLPADVPFPARKISIIDVAVAKRSHFDIYLPSQRMIAGIVFTDVDGDGKFMAGKDRPVEGAFITANGCVATSDARGAYLLSDLPPGRIGLLVSDAKKNENTHVLIDLGSSPVAKRILNIPMNRYAYGEFKSAPVVQKEDARSGGPSQAEVIPTINAEVKHFLPSPLVGEAYRQAVVRRSAFVKSEAVAENKIMFDPRSLTHTSTVRPRLVSNTAMVRPANSVGYVQTGTSMLLEEQRLMTAAGNNLRGYSTGDDLIDAFIVDSSRRYSIDPLLIYSQMSQESAFKRRALSNKGASGLMQLMPQTARRMGVSDIYDPKQNIEGGVKYMRLLLDMFDGNVSLALAGYNAGEGAVMKYGYQIPPYNETQDYVRRISSRYQTIARPVIARQLSY